jgi:peptidoglycan/LPS O-acetylase OafA/YrhL
LKSPAGKTSLQAWETYQSTTHFGSLDGLRCLSVVAVIWHHGPGISLPGLAGRGYMGVPLFFAISGFLITTLLLREQQRTGAISLRKFYIRRSLRIFPLYFAVLGMYCILIYVAARETDTARKFYANLPYFLTYTSNWFVGTTGTFAFAWSLAAEEQFYSTWPSVLRYLRPARAVWLAVTILAAGVAWNILASRGAIAGNFGLVVLENVPMAICWGCLVAFTLHNPAGFELVWRILGQRWTSAVVLCVIAAVLAAFERFEVPIHFLFAVLVASCVVREDNILAFVLRRRWVVHTGMISYGMYLMHGLVYDALVEVESRLPDSWRAHSVGGFLLALAVTIGVATFSFRCYETPFLRMKSRFAA